MIMSGSSERTYELSQNVRRPAVLACRHQPAVIRGVDGDLPGGLEVTAQDELTGLGGQLPQQAFERAGGGEVTVMHAHARGA
jgi:hypothetical protein